MAGGGVDPGPAPSKVMRHLYWDTIPLERRVGTFWGVHPLDYTWLKTGEVRVGSGRWVIDHTVDEIICVLDISVWRDVLGDYVLWRVAGLYLLMIVDVLVALNTFVAFMGFFWFQCVF